MFRRFSSWLTQLTARRRAPSDAEIARELRDHLALDAEALLADHRVPGTAAHHAARRRFGNLAATGESVHDVWHWSWLEQLGQDVRHGTRALARSPAYSVAVAVTLALGIGAGAAMFSLSEAFHHPFPFFPERRLLWITQHTSSCGVDCTQASPAAFVALRQLARTFTPVGAERWETTMRSGDGSEMVSGYLISSDAFTLLEAPFALGRGFAAGAGLPGAAKTLVLTYRFWHEHLAASRGVLDSVVTLGGAPFTVVGVLADGVVFPMVADAYAPLVLTAAASSDYGSRSVDLFARLAPGATLAAAAAEAATIEAQIARASPRTDSGWALTARPIAAYHTDDVVIIEQISAIAALLVFLAACMSAANLALSRAAARRNELALRAALGVRRWRLARHLLTEAMLVTLAACGVGALLARWAMHAMRDAIPADYAAFIPGWARLGLDSRTLMLTLATSVLAMLAFAALPALRATRVDLATVLSDGGRASTGGVRGTRTRATLVVLEVSIAIVLLTAAALFTESVRNMMTGDAGVRLDHVVVMHLSPPRGLTDSAGWDFVRRLDANLHATPGVRAAGLTSTTPLSNNYWGTAFSIPGRTPEPDGRPLNAIDQHVTPDYDGAAGMRIIAGRMIAPRDVTGAERAVVVSEMLAGAMWPGANALGRVVIVDSLPWTVVGVAANVHHGGLDEPMNYTMYRSVYQTHVRAGDLAIWTGDDPHAMRDVVRRVVARTDPSAAVGAITTMPEMQARHVSTFRMMAVMLAVLAFVTMCIATVGLYGLIAYGVAQRTREIGVRIALGARPRDIMAHIGGGAVRLAALGVAFGVAGAVAFARLLAAMLYGVTARDPRTFVAVSISLLIVALVAAVVPSWRASRVDPTVALRA